VCHNSPPSFHHSGSTASRLSSCHLWVGLAASQRTEQFHLPSCDSCQSIHTNSFGTSDQFNKPIGTPRLLIYESPLQCGTYKIVLHIFSWKGGVGAPAVIFRCTVHDPGFRWTSSGAAPAAPNLSVCPDRYTYSGYVQDNDCRFWCVWDNAHPDSLANGTKTELFSPQEMHLGLHLSAYNCVVTRVLQAGSVVWSYYL
jgi:hypothetical protein